MPMRVATGRSEMMVFGETSQKNERELKSEGSGWTRDVAGRVRDSPDLALVRCLFIDAGGQRYGLHFPASVVAVRRPPVPRCEIDKLPESSGALAAIPL